MGRFQSMLFYVHPITGETMTLLLVLIVSRLSSDVTDNDVITS